MVRLTDIQPLESGDEEVPRSFSYRFNFYRIILFLLIIWIPVFGFIHSPPNEMALRLAFAAVAIGILSCSYFYQPVQQQLPLASSCCLYAAHIFTIYLFWKSGFESSYFIPWMGLTVVGMLAFETRRQLLFFAGLILVALVVPAVFLETPDRYTLFLITESGLVVTAYFLLSTRLHWQQSEADERYQVLQAREYRLSVTQGMQNDLMIPVQALKKTLGDIRRMSLSAGLAPQLEVAFRSIDALCQIADDVRVLHGGKPFLYKEDLTENFSIPRTIYGVESILRAGGLLDTVTCKIKLDEGVPLSVSGNRVRLEEVLLHFLAAAATRCGADGTISLEIRKLSENEKSTKVGFWLTETECTIEGKSKEEDLLFSFVDAGVGMPHASRLVALLGGDIGVFSNESGGITVRLAFDFANAEIIDEPQPENRLETPQEFQGVNILVAEDSNLNRRLLTVLLERKGCTVHAVENGKEALDAVREKLYDMVLMDCQMPVMNGYEASTEIRKLFGDRIPIVAFTAAAFKEDIERCNEIGMSAFLEKPIVPAQLYSCMREVLSRNLHRKKSSV